jgi:hypothetical protein
VGALYLAFGSPVGVVPLLYFSILLGAIAVFARTRDFPRRVRMGATGTIAVKGKGEVEAWISSAHAGDRWSATDDGGREPTIADRGHSWKSRSAGPRLTRS